MVTAALVKIINESSNYFVFKGASNVHVFLIALIRKFKNLRMICSFQNYVQIFCKQNLMQLRKLAKYVRKIWAKDH